MSILERAEYLFHGAAARGKPGEFQPVRWWLTEADWRRLLAERAKLEIMPGYALMRRLFGLPIAIDYYGQGSRLVTRDGTAIPFWPVASS